jgi:hypothetical protein
MFKQIFHTRISNHFLVVSKTTDRKKEAKEWENTYGEEAIQKKSVRERLNNYRREVDERQAERSVYRSDRGAR